MQVGRNDQGVTVTKWDKIMKVNCCETYEPYERLQISLEVIIVFEVILILFLGCTMVLQ